MKKKEVILQDGWWLRHGLDEIGVICEAGGQSLGCGCGGVLNAIRPAGSIGGEML